MATRKKLKVEESSSLERDVFTNAILNTDNVAYNAALRRKKYIKSQERLVQELQKQVQELLQWKEEITAFLSKKVDK